MKQVKLLYTLIMVILLVSSCGKVTLQSNAKPSNLFNQDGRDFVFPGTVITDGKEIRVSIPAGAINGNAYLEFYQYQLQDAGVVDSFYINGTTADINLFVSDGNTLQVPATVYIPFYFTSTYVADSGYTPYRVHAASYTDLVTVLNKEENWEQITNFTWDNDSKHLIFQTTHLDGIYVVAKRK